MVLLQRTERATLEIDLDAIKHNLAFFRNKLDKNSTKLMVVLKASCYGTGDYELASMLQNEEVDYFAVACTDEGVLFRKHGVTIPIMVSNPSVDSFTRMIKYKLEPAIYSLSILRKLVDFVMRQKKHVSIHLKLETGMNGHGIEESDLDAAINVFLRECPFIKVKSIYSNLAGPNATSHDDYARIQATKFDRMIRRIEQELKIITIKHLTSTDGIIRHPEFHYDMVRLGSGLLGLARDDDAKGELVEAMTLKTIISQIRKVKEGSALGQDPDQVAPRDMDVAFIEIGYGDGLIRSLGNGIGKVLVNGHEASFVGNIGMDTSLIDITGMSFGVGDEVTVFGRTSSVKTVANAANTIPQEILSNISRRVKRVFCSIYHI